MCSNGSYNFACKPDAVLFCAVCLELASQPKQCEHCGKLFCTKCIEKSGRKPCPNCRTYNPRYFDDTKSKLCSLVLLYCHEIIWSILGKREIDELQVRCTNTERGCQWIGTLGTLVYHEAFCYFNPVPCPNKCGEDEGAGEFLLIRKHLDDHVKTKCPKRAYECPHCGEKGTFASITEDHDQVCEKKIVACSNKGSGCSLSMERGKTKEHVSSDCEYTEVACVYESLGCGVRMLRKDREKHEKEDREKHLDLSLATIRLREEQHKTLSEGEAVIFQLPGYASKKEKNETFYSTPFYTHPGGYKMCVNVDANGYGDGKGSHVSAFFKLVDGHYDTKLQWPFLGTVTFELLNQLVDDNHHAAVITLLSSNDVTIGSIRGPIKFLPHSSLGHNPATNTRYLLDDTLYFRVSVKVDNHKSWLGCTDKVTVDSTRPMNDCKTLRYGEMVVFKVANFSVWKATRLQVTSTSFYTSPGGYHMCIMVYADGYGDGEGTHVSLFTKILEGRYDSQLQWPFIGTVRYEILNQLGNNEHYSKVSTFTSNSDMTVHRMRGPTKFLPHSSLGYYPATNTQYLLDDTLYFRVSVEVDNHKPWLVCTHHTTDML